MHTWVVCVPPTHPWIMEWLHLKRHVCMDSSRRVHLSLFQRPPMYNNREWVPLTATHIYGCHSGGTACRHLAPQQAKCCQNLPLHDHKPEAFSPRQGTPSRRRSQDSCHLGCPSSVAWTHSLASYGWWASPLQSPSSLFPQNTVRLCHGTCQADRGALMSAMCSSVQK